MYALAIASMWYTCDLIFGHPMIHEDLKMRNYVKMMANLARFVGVVSPKLEDSLAERRTLNVGAASRLAWLKADDAQQASGGTESLGCEETLERKGKIETGDSKGRAGRTCAV